MIRNSQTPGDALTEVGYGSHICSSSRQFKLPLTSHTDAFSILLRDRERRQREFHTFSIGTSTYANPILRPIWRIKWCWIISSSRNHSKLVFLVVSNHIVALYSKIEHKRVRYLHTGRGRRDSLFWQVNSKKTSQDKGNKNFISENNIQKELLRSFINFCKFPLKGSPKKQIPGAQIRGARGQWNITTSQRDQAARKLFFQDFACAYGGVRRLVPS